MTCLSLFVWDQSRTFQTILLRTKKADKIYSSSGRQGTSLHCYYVKRWICMWHLFYTFLHNSSEGMFLCLPEELYILSAFFVSHIHSEITIHHGNRAPMVTMLDGNFDQKKHGYTNLGIGCPQSRIECHSRCGYLFQTPWIKGKKGEGEPKTNNKKQLENKRTSK